MSATATVQLRERPILFSGPMVRAILEGRKTRTRRVVKPQPEFCDVAGAFASWVFKKRKTDSSGLLFPNVKDEVLKFCPYGERGDRLWVRESFGIRTTGNNFGRRGHDEFLYRASESEEVMRRFRIKWKPSIFLPREHSRINLEITEIRVERLQEITENEVCFEGFKIDPFDDTGAWRANFANGWNAINEKRGYSWLT